MHHFPRHHDVRAGYRATVADRENIRAARYSVTHAHFYEGASLRRLLDYCRKALHAVPPKRR
jgi:hypothetical protein